MSDWNREQGTGERALRKPNVNPHEKTLMALRVIRTWAEFDLKHPEYRERALNPRHVVDLCDEAIEAAKAKRGVA